MLGNPEAADGRYFFVFLGFARDDCPHVVAARQLEGGDHLGSDASLRTEWKQVRKYTVMCQSYKQTFNLGFHLGLCLGCLQATPSFSEAALVDPDFTVSTISAPVADGPHDHRF